MKRVHCLGVLVVDALGWPVAHYPVPKKVEQVTTQSLRFQPGGGAANTGSALAQMGLPVAVFSKVGDDPNGRFLIEELGRHGVDTSGIRMSPFDTTPFTYVGIHPDGDRTFLHTPGANKTFNLQDIDRQALLAADFLLCQDCWVLPALDGAPAAELLAEARGRGLITFLDECWGFGPNREIWERMIPHADYILPSIDDMLAIYPGLSAEDLAATLHGRGARNVVLKMGKDGCLVSCGGRSVRIPSMVTQIVDTTGAGDCFDAGFIAGLAHGLKPAEAGRMGALAAAACIRNIGGATGIPRGVPGTPYNGIKLVCKYYEDKDLRHAPNTCRRETRIRILEKP